jgi:methionine-rich copper-binding protein CopC
MKGLGAAVALAALLLGAGVAWSHAFLERAEPRVGSTVKSAPSQVRAWFTQELEPAFSTLEVVNEKGERVDRGPAQVDASSRALLLVPLKPLGPGTYRVKWRVLSVDTHVTEGDFTFRVTSGSSPLL